MEEGQKVKCQRCGYEWDYKGQSEWYATCPRCRTTINLKNQNPSNGKNDKD